MLNTCVRCEDQFRGRWPKSKICPKCSLRGAPRGDAHWNYQHGGFTYETIRGEIKELVRFCERCAKDLIDAAHHEWAVHHKDHDRQNSARDNLELLCKRCHQIEHECWRNFEGATTSREA